MKIDLKTILSDLIKGIVLAVLYFEITHANDTTPKNIFLFASFYIVMVNSAKIVGIDANVVTSAFVTKTIFTLIDERVKRKDNENEKKEFKKEKN